MGLDIAFNREAAVAAGLELVTEQRDPDFANRRPDADQDELNFWNEKVTYIRVPNVDLMVEDCGAQDNIVVRANKWGSVYAPLTDWLKQNNITWGEF